MATYRVEIDYWDEYLEEQKTHTFLTECDTEDQAHESWSYGEDIAYDTVSDVRVIPVKAEAQEADAFCLSRGRFFNIK